MIEIERSQLGLMMEAGYILLGMQRYKEAQEVFEGITVMAPDSDIPVVALGSVEFCQGKFAQAMKRYKTALKKNPESAYAQAYMGEALFFSGKKKEAVAALKKVAKIDAEGKAGDFAQALLDAIKKGFDPDMLSGHEEINDYVEKKKRSHKKR
jgi:tetratricopeptide (TPR) repeat protein